MWQNQAGFAEMFIEFCSCHGLKDYRGILYEILSIYENQMKISKEVEKGFDNYFEPEKIEGVEYNDDMDEEEAPLLHAKEEVHETDERLSVTYSSFQTLPDPTSARTAADDLALRPVVSQTVKAEQTPGNSQLNSQLEANTKEMTAVQSDKRQPTCHICGKSFRNAYYIKFHLRMHSGDNPHECRICRRRFPFRSKLVRHELAHTGTRTFFCSVCQRSFLLKHHLTSHVRRKHPEYLSQQEPLLLPSFQMSKNSVLKIHPD